MSEAAGRLDGGREKRYFIAANKMFSSFLSFVEKDSFYLPLRTEVAVVLMMGTCEEHTAIEQCTDILPVTGGVL